MSLYDDDPHFHDDASADHDAGCHDNSIADHHSRDWLLWLWIR
jgi:hypothetical protein